MYIQRHTADFILSIVRFLTLVEHKREFNDYEMRLLHMPSAVVYSDLGPVSTQLISSRASGDPKTHLYTAPPSAARGRGRSPEYRGHIIQLRFTINNPTVVVDKSFIVVCFYDVRYI